MWAPKKIIYSLYWCISASSSIGEDYIRRIGELITPWDSSPGTSSQSSSGTISESHLIPANKVARDFESVGKWFQCHTERIDAQERLVPLYDATSPQVFTQRVVKDVARLKRVKDMEFDQGTVALVGYTVSTYIPKKDTSAPEGKRLSLNVQWAVALASPTKQF